MKKVEDGYNELMEMAERHEREALNMLKTIQNADTLMNDETIDLIKDVMNYTQYTALCIKFTKSKIERLKRNK